MKVFKVVILLISMGCLLMAIVVRNGEGDEVINKLDSLNWMGLAIINYLTHLHTK